jgi:hypothetical protein
MSLNFMEQFKHSAHRAFLESRRDCPILAGARQPPVQRQNQ